MTHPPEENFLGSEPKKKDKLKYLPEPTERDFVEDLEHGSGYYQNTCRECKLSFFGFKQRMWCKVCTKPNEVKKKKPTGILKDLIKIQRYLIVDGKFIFHNEKGNYVKWSDVEAIINKYSNP